MNEFDNEYELNTDVDPDLNSFNQIYPELRSEHSSNYHDLSSFNKKFSKTEKDFAVIHVNIRSLFNKIDTFTGLLSLLSVKFDAICVSESWLNDNDKDLISLPGYNVFHCLRPVGIGAVEESQFL